MTLRTIVLDANVLIRAVLGRKVIDSLIRHAENARFLVPDSAFDEAREHLPQVLAKRGVPEATRIAALEKLDAIRAIVTPVPIASFESLKERA